MNQVDFVQLCLFVANAPLASRLLSELALSSLRPELHLNPLQSTGCKIVAQASATSLLEGGRGNKRANDDDEFKTPVQRDDFIYLHCFLNKWRHKHFRGPACLL